jgi:hypothetical protein
MFTRELSGPGLPGLLFRAGEKVVATDIVDARASSTPFIAGGMRGLYAMDTSVPRSIGLSFVAIPLERTVPNIVLVGRRIGALALGGFAMHASQRLSLEGDFDRYFSLYCPVDYERDALQIFTPNLMQLLIDTTSDCDVELVDDWMFVYSRWGRTLDSEALDRLEAVTGLVQSTVERQTSRYRDERSEPAGSTVSPEEHAARVGRVAASGARLTTRTSLLQRLVTIGSTVLLVGALGYVFVNQILPRL